jgi:hypothetical protein
LARATASWQALQIKRWAGEGMGLLWSITIAATLAYVVYRVATRGDYAILAWFQAWFTLAEALGENVAAPVMFVIEVAYLWFWGWLALDAYQRRFGDSEVFSIRRVAWLGAIVGLPGLAAPLYWFAVKRRAVLAQLRAYSEGSVPGAARLT